MEYFIDKVDKTQEGVQFNWQGRVRITIEPTDENFFKGGEPFWKELNEYYNYHSSRGNDK